MPPKKPLIWRGMGWISPRLNGPSLTLKPRSCSTKSTAKRNYGDGCSVRSTNAYCWFDTVTGRQQHFASLALATGGKERSTMKNTGKITDQAPPIFDHEGYQTNLADLGGERLPDLAKAITKPASHGGLRRGAGRKPSGRRPVQLRLSEKTIARLRKVARQNHKSLSDIVEARLADL